MKLFACPIPDTGKTAAHDTAHQLLRRVLQEFFGLPLPEIARDSHGKPFFPDVPQLHFNLSHCRGLAVCGVSDRPIGVDAEEIRPLRERVLRRAFSPEETRTVRESQHPDEYFFRLWTLKESYVKAIGVGISYPLQTLSFVLDGDSIQTSVSGWQFGQFLVQPGWVVSCCVGMEDTLPDKVIFLNNG
ncbi:4'-phosphopantetheinyl transferase superfamily protein [uncultured Ruminococcus sp.]|uniref:4'-phosphopantetheinyl transferase family protein n=1 Tax=uncultured Ruminococcus sp. TaxID=165186 RepID=UPI00261A6C29|nr:4'-phosphopantetheinyl transferase superfamily protein [uncultured Ruminococcus sp.]